MADTTVQYDKQKNVFIVRCPFYANDVVQAAPSKRWNKQARAWLMPATRKNAEFIESKLKGLADIDDEAKAMIRDVKSEVRAVSKVDEFPSWYPFKTEPRTFQRDAYAAVYGKHTFGLYMDMGTGKTKTATDIAAALNLEGKVQAVLVVCKLSLSINWAEEFEKHCPVPYALRLHTNDKSGFQDWMWENKDVDLKVYIVGTESLSSGSAFEFAEKFLMLHTKTMCIIDEAHMISNHKAVRSERAVILGRNSNYRAILTGTPITEGPMNLFMQFEFLDPNIIGIGDFYAFRNHYAVMGGYMKEDERTGKKKAMEIVGYQNLEELMSTVAPYIFQVRKHEVLKEIPPKTYQVRHVNMSEKQRALYKQIKSKKGYEWEGAKVVPQNVLELSLRLHQVCGGFVATKDQEFKIDKETGDLVAKEFAVMNPIFDKYDDNPKIAELRTIFEEAPGVPTAVWCKYMPEMDAVQELARSMGRKMARIDGSVPAARRMEILREFQDGKWDSLVANQQTGGTGLNMTMVTLSVYYSNTFSLIDRLQSEDRHHRIGQTNAVLYIDLVVSESVDELVLESIQLKVNMSEFIRQKISDRSLHL